MSEIVCEFLVTTWGPGDQVNAGKITCEDGELTCDANKGWTKVLNEIMKTESYNQEGKKFDPDDDPEGWIKSLPYQYSGSALRARLVKGGDNGKKKAN